MNQPQSPSKLTVLLLLALAGSLASTHGQTLFNFPFNEGGTNKTFTDTAQGLQGSFGAVILDPLADTVALTNDSPSGLPGDGSFVNSGKGFLVADDSTSKVLNIT